jgi:hypothetical protein
MKLDQIINESLTEEVRKRIISDHKNNIFEEKRPTMKTINKTTLLNVIRESRDEIKKALNEADETTECSVKETDETTECDVKEQFNDTPGMMEGDGEFEDKDIEGYEENCDDSLQENNIKQKRIRKIRLKESQIIYVINHLVESEVPVLLATKRANSEGEKETKQYLKDLDKKLNDYQDFEGNDNPEFPNPIGSGEKMAHKLTDDDNEFIEEYRGGGMEDLNFDTEPSKDFTNRLEKAMTGDSTMGNPVGDDVANAIKTDVGKDKFDMIGTKKKVHEKDPMYVKDAQPITNINEEINRMKKIYNYNKDTQ